MTRPRRLLPSPSGLILTLTAVSSSFKFVVFEQTASGAPRTWLRGEVAGLGAAARMVTHDAGGSSIADERWPDRWTPDFDEVLAHGAVSDPWIEEHQPSRARYAGLCQKAGVVSIVEPEVLMAGAHTMVLCEEGTGEVLGPGSLNCARSRWFSRNRSSSRTRCCRAWQT